MRRFTAYRLWLMWDELQAKNETNEKAIMCLMQKVRLQMMYEL